MPIKFNKEVSAHLFKYVKDIKISFNPFDSRTRSARELIRQVHAPRFAKSNPKLKIGIDRHSRPDEPLATFFFVDGTDRHFQTQSNSAQEMIFQIHLKAMQLDAEYEMAGKSVDEAA